MSVLPGPVDNLTIGPASGGRPATLSDMDTDDPIPPLLPVHMVPPLRTQSDLHRQWRAMMGPLGFSARRLWLLFLEPDDRPTGMLMEIDDVPESPAPGETDSLLRICRELQAEHGLGRVAVLLSRPGEGLVRATDRRWGRALLASARRLGVPFAPVHLATDDAVLPLTGDDLLVGA